jgi:peptidoglycan lytic transglycosylase G
MIKGAADELLSVTIPPGKTIVDVAELFGAAGITPKDEILARATDAAFVRSLELPGASLEGYLYPDTYRMRPHTPADRALIPLVRRHRQVFEELRAKHPVGVANLRKTLGFDDARIVILASIVEKETARPEERPRIAQLYLNRLTKPNFVPRRLEADPTIIYGCTVAPLFMGKASPACSQWKGNIQYIHLRDTENPFNTYTHEGLPPGPITNPGRAALEAVMKPDGSPYLWFVAKGDGTGSHFFSSTVAEHTAAVVKYQRGGKAMPKSRQ